MASTALLAPQAVAAKSPKSHHSNLVRQFRAPVMPHRVLSVAKVANSVIASREARGLTTNPGPAGNDLAPHWFGR